MKQRSSIASRLGYGTLCAALAGLSTWIAASGVMGGRIDVPVRAGGMVERAAHPFWFWLCALGWLLAAAGFAAGAVAIVRDRPRLRAAAAPSKVAPTPKAAAARPAQPAAPLHEVRSTSPDGRYEVRVYPWEVRMSLWVDSPAIHDTATGRTVFAPDDSHWSLGQVEWRSASVVQLQLRHYPGDHVPAWMDLTLDCAKLDAGRAEQQLRQMLGASRRS